MKSADRIRATSLAEPLFAGSIASLGFFCLFWEGIHISRLNRLLLMIGFLISVPYCIHQLTHTRFLTKEGVVCFRFGKAYRTLPWNQVIQVCIARDVRTTHKGSSASRILIIPAGCSRYDSSVWSGLEYLRTFRGLVIWVDNSRRNREYIEKHFGPIERP